MDIVCEKCQSKFKLPDEKIPPGKVVSIPCSKCKSKITVGAEKQGLFGAKKAPEDVSEMDDGPADTYDAAEKPFDFVEEEGKTALICASDPTLKKEILAGLEKLEYHITDAKNTRTALRSMRYHVYDMVLVDESFDTKDPDQNAVLKYLERVPMAIRRNIFVALISKRHRTMDNMMAFNKSVNMVLSVKNIGEIEKILVRGITDNDFFYRVYQDRLKKLGNP